MLVKLYKIYLALLSIFVLIVIFTVSINKVSYRGIWGILDIVFSLAAILGVTLYILKKNLFPKMFWKIFSVVYIGWDLSLNLLIEPSIDHKALDLTRVALPGILLISLPMYIALILYSYKKN